MDSLNSDVPGALALDQLCAAAAHELLMRSYTTNPEPLQARVGTTHRVRPRSGLRERVLEGPGASLRAGLRHPQG